MSIVVHADFSTDQRKKLAEKGEAMPDGSFPIRNRSDLINAIQAVGRAKDYEATKKYIMKRAKDLDAEDLLPDTWTSSAAQSAMVGRDFLEHYGVKGMKWGVRKKRNEGDRKKTFGKGTNNQQKSVKDLSDKELRDVVNRLNMEQQYARLTSGSSGSRTSRLIGAGAAFIAGIALNVARQQIQNQANAQIAKGLAARTAKKAAGS